MCDHTEAIQQITRAKPPGYVSYPMRYSVCSCGVEFCTTKQRRKNRKNFHQAQKRAARQPVYITDPVNGLW